VAEQRPLTIGALARLAQVNIQTVRYYERLGLLEKPRKPARGYRQYDEQALARLRFIRRAASLGFTLNETKELLSLRAREGEPCRSVRLRAEQKLGLIDQKLAELRRLRSQVAWLVGTCSGDTAIRHCSILEYLGEAVSTPNEKETAMTDAMSTDTLFACIRACESCIEDCLGKNTPEHVECIRACRDCIDACLLTARLIARGSPLAEEAKKLCAIACRRCAEACEKAGCGTCQEACASCATACSA